MSATQTVTLEVDSSANALRFTPSGSPALQLDIESLLGVVPDSLLAPLSTLLQQLSPQLVTRLIKPIEVPLPRLPLSRVIQGSTQTLGLTAPTVSVDAANLRITVAGDLAAE